MDFSKSNHSPRTSRRLGGNFAPALFGGLAVLLLVQLSAADTPSTLPTTQPAGVEFMSVDAGKTAIVDDSLDPFFVHLTEHEMSAKTSAPITGATPAAKLAECKKRFADSVVEFTTEEKEAFSFFIVEYQKNLTRDYPLFGRQPWSFIKVRDSLEGGMPHTRGPHIIVPQSMASQFAMMRQHGGPGGVMEAASILVHEQTHVVQRLHPQAFAPFYTDALHFIHAKEIKTCAWLDDRQLINPDGIICDWIYPETIDGKPGFILPLIGFEAPNAPNMQGNMRTIAVRVEPVGNAVDGVFKPVIGGDGSPIVYPLDEFKDYIKAVGTRMDDYHPNEITADRFAELYVFDYLAASKAVLDRAGPERVKSIKARLDVTRDWARKAFADAKTKQ